MVELSVTAVMATNKLSNAFVFILNARAGSVRSRLRVGEILRCLFGVRALVTTKLDGPTQSRRSCGRGEKSDFQMYRFVIYLAH